MRWRQTRLPVLLSALGLGLLACERASDSGSAPFLRLVDAIDRAELESAIDLENDARFARLGVHEVGCQQLPAPNSRRLRLLEGEWIATLLENLPRGGESTSTSDGQRAAGLWLEPGQAIVRVFDADPNLEYDVRAYVDAGEASGLALLALQLDERPTGDELGDPEWLARSVAGSLGTAGLLEPRGPAPDGLEEHGTWIRTGENTRAVMIGATTAEGAVGVRGLCLFERSAFVAQLRRHPRFGGSAHLRRVEVGWDFRESIVLSAPGAARFRVELPGPGTRLSMVVAGLEDLRTPALTVEVEARPGDGGGAEDGVRTVVDIAAARPRAPPGWTPIELDLSSLSGTIDLEIRVTPESTFPHGCGVAIGNPLLVAENLVADRPDVVLVSLDTLRADRLAAYGGEAGVTPHLDRLAARARVFRAAVAPAAYTLPSHASLLTGQLPDRHGAIGQSRRLESEQVTLLAERYRAAGYETIALTGGGYLHPDLGFADGFERYGTWDPARDPAWARRASSADYRRRIERMASATWSRDAMVSALERPVRRRPLFLFVHTYAAHNYVAPEPDLRAVGLEPGELAGLIGDLSLTEFCRLASTAGEDVETTARIERLYDASVRVADDLLGSVVTSLERANRLDDTHLVVVSDHGEELFERGRFGHGFSVYEEMIRVPMLFAGPGIAAGTNDEVVSLIDVAPTLLELGGFGGGTDAIDGRSLAPLLSDGSRFQSPALSVADDPDGRRVRSLRGRAWKLIDGSSEEEEDGPRWLFDLRDDPSEQRDRAPEEGELEVRLRTVLRERVEQARAAAAGGGELEMSPELERALRELGYLDG